MIHDPGEMRANWAGYWHSCSCGYEPQLSHKTRRGAKKDIDLHLKHAAEDKLWYVVDGNEVSPPVESKRDAYLKAGVRTGTLLAPGVYSVGAHVFVTRFPDLCLI